VNDRIWTNDQLDRLANVVASAPSARAKLRLAQEAFPETPVSVLRRRIYGNGAGRNVKAARASAPLKQRAVRGRNIDSAGLWDLIACGLSRRTA
jgi:hypothetical protein